MARFMNTSTRRSAALGYLLACLAPVVSAQVDSPAVDVSANAVYSSQYSNQSFTLFEGVETSAQSRANAPTRPGRESRVTVAAPEFTLIGTSRIGDSYSALLRHRDGDTIAVKAASDVNTRIPGHTDYTVVAVSAGSVSIRYPDNHPCEEHRDRGVSCSGAGNIAALELANAEPVAQSQATRTAVAQGQLGGSDASTADAAAADTDNAPPDNPFAALRAARLGGQAGQLNGQNSGDAADPSRPQRFEPRRIAPEDVPPGMRVVSTPFGDRLVEQ
jgi:hypothetical protein